MKTYNYIYKIKNIINGKIYIGKHSTDNLNIGDKNGFYGKHHKKYKWMTPDGEIKEMSLGAAHKHHPDWTKIED